MNNQELDDLILAYFEVKQVIMQLNFILSLIQAEIVRLTEEGNNQEEIDDLIQDSFVVTQVILQLTFILSLIQAEIVRLSQEDVA